MNELEFRNEMRTLITRLISQIGEEYRASEDDDAPSMCVTVGADAKGWNYQTGDNSFSGGAYGYADWAVVSIYRDSDPEAVAAEIADQLAELSSDDEPIFTTSAQEV